MSEDRHINFKVMRDRIAGSEEGKNFWRSLEELGDSPEFREFVQREYPQHAEEWDDPVERRTFLKLMGASLALAGLSGCVYQPPEKIIPFVRQPHEAVPGKALFFATAATLGGIATPLLARSNEGRPTKLEGNPDHPNSRSADTADRGSSATDLFAQASVLDLYDPDRSQTVTYREEIRTWTAFLGEMRTALDEQRPKQGAGLRLLTETVTSPSLGAQLKAILAEFPQAKWHQYEPVNRDNARAGAITALGQPVNTIYQFDQAERTLSLDADFLSGSPGTLRYARDFAARRRVTEGKHEMSRLYVVETTPTTTGASADHRWAVRPSEMEGFVSQLAARLGAQGPSASASSPGQRPPTADHRGGWIEPIARDLQQHRGASIVIAGNEAPPAVHALAHAMNSALGNIGKTVSYTDPLEVNSVDQRESLRELVQDIDGGLVELLVILGGNPAYNTPADLKLDQNRLFKTKLRVHLSSHKDETSELCHWHIPEAHYLESWGDTRSFDGTVTIVQPLIEPLYGSKNAHEVLAVFSEQYDRKAYDIVRDYWRGTGRQEADGTRQTAGGSPPVQQPAVPTANQSAEFEVWWRKALHDGFVPKSALPGKTVSLSSQSKNNTAVAGTPVLPARTSARPAETPSPPVSDTRHPTPGTYEVVFRTDPSIFDGRFANNGWLQELPKPLTKLTWDNAALVSPNTARRLGLENTIGWKGGEILVDNITIEHRGQSVTSPTWIMPGQPDEVITLHLGYGRQRAGRVGNKRGFNAYTIRTSDSPWTAAGVKV
ncbi:MAG: TAT-variant-translocated molybdopterin oxidoreductase, partial [Pyrinomonadaceae bacterium]|nr:TAT-variant-translocated molybdopterin oxidoreductase [Pyrinomonadaceae bacterium]